MRAGDLIINERPLAIWEEAWYVYWGFDGGKCMYTQSSEHFLRFGIYFH